MKKEALLEVVSECEFDEERFRKDIIRPEAA